MSPEEQLARAAAALEEGRISQAEYVRFARSLEPPPAPRVRPVVSPQPSSSQPPAQDAHQRHKREVARKAGAIALLLCIMAAFLWAISSQGTPTGLVPLDTGGRNATLNESGSIALNATNITALRVSGRMNGTGAMIYLRYGESRLLIARLEAARTLRTDKLSYALGEQVNFSLEPAADATYWLTAPDGAKSLFDPAFIAAQPGEHLLEALVNDSGNVSRLSAAFLVRNDTDLSLDVAAPAAQETPFAGACEETCALPPTGDAPLRLEIGLATGATLELQAIDVEYASANRPPVQRAALPNLTVMAGESAVLDLSPYFADPENDALAFDYMSVPFAALSVNGTMLIVTGESAGEAQSVIYANDGEALVQSEPFTITVLAADNQPSNRSNATPDNETIDLNETADLNTTLSPNGTGNSTGALNATSRNATTLENATGTGAPGATDAGTGCAGTDPNKLPVACLYRNTTEYFPEDEILLQDLDRAPVARFTPIGNLLLKGGIVEQSGGEPGARDFRIGYVDRDGNSVATIWVDGETGDLHLRGRLIEENTNLQPPPGSYSLTNKRSVFLAYADQYNGDLYVRGNAIPYRRDIMK